jgi:hypothetical protein
MPKKSSLPKRPRDVNKLAAHIGKLATHEIEDEAVPVPDEKAVRRGHARAKALTPKKRSAIAQKAAKARWNKPEQ